MWPDSTE